MPRRLELLEAIEGYYATAALLGLRRLGILDQLERPQMGSVVTGGADPQLIGRVLEFLARTTTVVVQAPRGRYRLANVSSRELSFQLEKFAGAYGRAVHAAGAARVDGAALATAFTEAAHVGPAPVAEIVRRAGVRCLLDLGCGPASLLIELARRDSGFRGMGVDSSAAMCGAARQAVREAGVSGRVRIRRADARRLRAVLSPADCRQIEALHGASFLNEFFGRADGRDAVRVLRGLRRLFPGRRAWFVDYYGRLDFPRFAAADCSLALLQDLAQAVSGQGVPPPDLRAWRRIYAEAGCRYLQAQEYESTGIRWFIHEVTL